MQAIFEPLKQLPFWQDIKKTLPEQPGYIEVSGCIASQRTHLAAAFQEDYRYTIIVAEGEVPAREIVEELSFVRENVFFYPARDLLFYEADIRGEALAKERMAVLEKLFSGASLTIVTTMPALMEGVLSREEMEGRFYHVDMASRVDLEDAERKISLLGYRREEMVSQPGDFAVRGGILDIYPLSGPHPVRIELWGDEVDSIRAFDADSQRSVSDLEDIKIYPATDYPEEKGRKNSLISYFDPSESLVVLMEQAHLIEAAETMEEEILSAAEGRKKREMLTPMPYFLPVKDLVRILNGYSGLMLSTLNRELQSFDVRNVYRAGCQSVLSYRGHFDQMTEDLSKKMAEGCRAVIFAGSRTRARRLAEDLRAYGLRAYAEEKTSGAFTEGEILVSEGQIASGYMYPAIHFLVIAETDVFGKKKKRRKRKKYDGDRLQGLSELSVGDYVVHESHGLGIYAGLEKIEVDGVVKDYIKIAYEGSGNLYIPATQLDLLQKYASKEAEGIKLNRLGTREWAKTKSRVRRAVQDIAKDLIKLYAERSEAKGHAFAPDTMWQKEFEEMFPYAETDDQLLAITETKRDMESDRVMDRLICGDVGYGKTEVAIRAAFKAVMDSKQVAFLVPTTILAEQHYNTFKERLKDFPVRVDLLCRFRTPAQQKKTLEDTKKGLVDIVIGTHRLLSKDLEFKRLGLLIVDEEQRFGVKHKERLKVMRKNVDVLTLTATPIPRTLHMSLIGIRDLSVLEEPPMDRLPIETYVMEMNPEIVKEAIRRELRRDGQVYYVYNRVKDIEELTLTLRKLVPEAEIAFAHGQMKERELENVMRDFIRGDIDVLVSTTIIETGLDIANANTMIIHDAENFGLSQLYQLRGRVGRSNRTSYAFLLYRKGKMLKDVAERRLSAIREFTDLGSGFKIAMRDLEIRGAGNLLGAEQHGHMEAVGYDLYCKMLSTALKSLKGEGTHARSFATTIDISVDAYIPEKYIRDEKQRVDLYKRIALIASEEEKRDMLEELIDRFSDPPVKVMKLLDVALIKAKAHKADITAVEQKGETVTFTMFEEARIDVTKIGDMVKKFQGALKFEAQTPVRFQHTRRNTGKRETGKELLSRIENVIDAIGALIPEEKTEKK